MNIELDKKDIIIGLGASWNESLIVPLPSLHDHAIVGQSLFTFIQGDNTRMAVESVLMQARAYKRSVKKRYRCDSPLVNRFFEMDMSPIDNFGIHIEHTLLKIEQKPLASAISENKDPAPCVSDTLIRCSFCCQFLYADSWLEVEDYSVIMKNSVAQLFSDAVEYRMCESCWNHLTNHDCSETVHP